tara:strand:+ start:81 stop:476 length:396 start_codon:yes stop_codon:yes gene_type:complete
MKSTQWLINELNNSPAFQGQLFKEEFSIALEMENTMTKLLHDAPLYYPSAKEWMWNYCIYLGPFTDSKGDNYDLGIYIQKFDNDYTEYSNATVYGNESGQYMSGELQRPNGQLREVATEVVRRAKELNLIP